MGVAAKAALVTVLALAGTGMASAQDSTAPLFSTPASRSTTGAPILNDPSQQNEGNIGIPLRQRSPSGASGAVKPAQKQSAQGAAKASQPDGGKAREWSLQCAEVAKIRRCQVMGSVVSADGKQVVMVMSLAAIDDKQTATQIAVPLGIALKPGIKIDVGGAYATTMPVSRCTSQGCLVESNVDGALLDAMKTKSDATVTVTTPEGKTVPIKLSLDGFSDAFAAMTKADRGAK
jgi:invasion protein IalB